MFITTKKIIWQQFNPLALEARDLRTCFGIGAERYKRAVAVEFCRNSSADIAVKINEKCFKKKQLGTGINAASHWHRVFVQSRLRKT